MTHPDDSEQDAEIIEFPASASSSPDEDRLSEEPAEGEAGDELELWDPGELAPTPRVYATVSDIPIGWGSVEDAKRWLSDCYWGTRLWFRGALIHLTHSPLYAARASRHAPLGLGRVVAWWWRWVRDMEGIEVRVRLLADPMVTADKVSREFQAAYEARKVRVRVRWGITAGGVLAVIIAGSILRATHPVLGMLVGVPVLLVAFGLIGARRGDVVATPVYMPETRPTITIEMVQLAYFRAKIAPREEEPAQVIGLPRQMRLGTLIKVDAPIGTSFEEILKRKGQLASGLKVPVLCLDLDPLDDEAEGVHELFVANDPPSKVKVPPWPLLIARSWDIFRPIPVGWTPKGELVCLSLLWVHTLIGAMPRRGKSNILRLLALAVLLDKRCRLIIVDFGGGVDFRPFRSHAMTFIHGPSEERIREFCQLLSDLHREYERRQARLDELGEQYAPEGRLTPALAQRVEFAPIVVIVDEFQVATSSALGKGIVKAWAELEKLCAKVGITIVKATQTADDDVPTELRNISAQRVCLTMASYQASMAILGNAAQRLGLDASTLGGTPGLAMMWGTDSGDEDGYRGKLKFANVTVADAAAVLARIDVRAPVEAALEDEDAEDERPDLIKAVLAAWPNTPHQPNCHRDLLAEWMGMDSPELTDELGKLGVECTPQRMIRPGDSKSTTQRGFRWADVVAVR